MLKKILIVLVVLIVGVCGFAATRPDTYHVERSTKIAAPADVVFAQVSDFKKWAAWSPWDKLDPTMKRTFGGTEGGKGQTYAWVGNDKVGEVKMTLTDVAAPTKAVISLEFIKPWEGKADTAFAIKPEGEAASSVIWSMDGKNNFMGKLMSLFMDMDKMIGDDYASGLTALKTVSEKVAVEAAAAKKKAAEEAAAAVAAAAAAAAAATAAAPPSDGAAPASAAP